MTGHAHDAPGIALTYTLPYTEQHLAQPMLLRIEMLLAQFRIDGASREGLKTLDQSMAYDSFLQKVPTTSKIQI